MKYKAVCNAATGQILIATINKGTGLGIARLADMSEKKPFAIYGRALEEIKSGDIITWKVDKGGNAHGWRKAQ